MTYKYIFYIQCVTILIQIERKVKQELKKVIKYAKIEKDMVIFLAKAHRGYIYECAISKRGRVCFSIN